MMDFQNRYHQYANLIEKELEKQLAFLYLPQQTVVEAMKYSLLGGGKRFRAILTLAFSEQLFQNIEDAIPLACAVEMIHAYSLIHDDLPCMDNDDLRRGKPSCHIAYGEAIALLAGDALLTNSFWCITSNEYSQKIEAKNILKVASLAAHTSGFLGMIGGQVMDMQSEAKQISISELQQLHHLKTGELIRFSAVSVCMLNNGSEKVLDTVSNFAKEIGIAFQVIDDILDVIGDNKLLGKKVGSDVENNKTTYVSLLGLEKAKKIAQNHINTAKHHLDTLGIQDSFLYELSDMIVSRKF
ncbi:MAG: polyprenyl synthetase family protein [Oscillospiraceae bacterium]